MRASIATVSMGGLLTEKFEAIADAGFEGVELFEADLLAHDGTPEDIAAMAGDLGLEIVALQPLRDFETMTGRYRERAFATAESRIDLARRLGAPRLLVCSNTSPHSVGGIDRAAADLRELGDLAEAAGIDIGYEALGWGQHVRDYRDAWEIVRRADHPRVGIVLDSFHIQAPGLPLGGIRAIPADRITLVQVSDAPLLSMDILQLSRHFRCFPGQGELDVTAFLEALGATGYDGWVSHEIFSDRFRMGQPARIAFDGARSMLHLTGREKGGGALPAPFAVEGVCFIEFSVSDEDATTLGALFRGMGFRLSGRHRSKAVARFTQGDVNLVINTEKSGFAHAHHLTHGASVAAIGLWVDDAHRATDRAEALLARTYRQPVAPGELEIPAIRGVGGSLLYFLDRHSDLADVWEIEFEPVEEGDADSGLERVDHIAQTIPFEELQSWRLFYSAVLGFERTPNVDVADPAGLVESQVLYSPDQSVRFALNASLARRTQTSQFIAEYFGAGVQHIAFATGDIVGSVRAMRAAGVALLAIPGNYYDDLGARFGLPPDEVAVLRELGILYDEDASGRYWQVYTAVIADRFFFEVVQRDGYLGFGAANAPIRLAAQTRLSQKKRPAGL